LQIEFFEYAEIYIDILHLHIKDDNNFWILDFVPNDTNGFKEMTSSFYILQGILPNGNTVAVKQLFAKTSQGIDEFLNEVVLLTGMKHRNLVNLKGCCIRQQQRLLVYEYVDNYDVDQVLLCEFNPQLRTLVL
jgi:hypothetical protein